MPPDISSVFEVRAIVPEPWDVDKLVDKLKASMQHLANSVKADFEATVSSWEEPAEFITDVTEEGGDLVTRIYTDSARWLMLDAGTAPRVFTANTASGVIAFRPEFTPKTTPRVFGSGGGSVGGETVFTRVVNHPGITPRQWTQAALEKYSPQIATHAQQGLFLGMWAATKGYKSETVSG